MRLRLAVMTCLLAGAAGAQTSRIEPLDPDDTIGRIVEDVIEDEDLGNAVAENVAVAEIAPGAVLRALDRLTSELQDIPLENGQQAQFGDLTVELAECRYPDENPTGEAFAFLTVQDKDDGQVFRGWMIASSPALNAMDHSRYDIWVLRCRTS